MTQNAAQSKDLYRSGVGITLLNPQGKVFIGERLDNRGSWQMPQGGIEPDEIPEIAVFREMEEEIGTRKAEILGMMDDWLYYDFPDYLHKKLFNGKYRGQRQKWIALKFTGDDSDIDLAYHTHPEFGAWQWVELEEMMGLIVPFKQDVYRKVIECFNGYAEDLKTGK